MVSILAVDTSADACSVALKYQNNLIERTVRAPREHTQRLLPMIDEVLQSAGITLADLNAIAYGRGPGSFTGLRICLGVVQGLAYAADLPVIPVSTLQALAVGANRRYTRSSSPSTDRSYEQIVIALDARMSEVYWGAFSAHDLLLNGSERVSPPDILADYMSEQTKQCLCVGPGWHYDALQSVEFVNDSLDMVPEAQDILTLAEALYDEGKAVAVENAQPTYLRDSVAWQKRKRIRQTDG